MFIATAGSLPSSQTTAAPVVVRDDTIFVFRTGRAQVSAAERATQASRALTQAVSEEGEPLIVSAGDDATLFVAEKPLFVLTLDDAVADGDTNLSAFAERRRAEISDFLHAARRRAHLQRLFLNISLVVSLAFFSVLLLVQLQRLSRNARGYIDSPERIQSRPFVRRVLEDERLRWLLVLLTYTAQIVLQIGVVYLLLLASFSLFETSRPWRLGLTQLASEPLVLIGKRLLLALPTLAMFVLLLIVWQSAAHAINLAFDTATRRRRPILGVRPSAMPALRLVAHASVFLGVLLLLAPFVANSSDHILARIGLVLLSLIGIALVPLLANMAVGMWTVFAGSLVIGEHVRIGAANGTLQGIDLFGLQLRDAHTEHRVPHLLLLWTRAERRPVMSVSLRGDEASLRQRAEAFAEVHSLKIPQIDLTQTDGTLLVHISIAEADPDLYNDFLRALVG